MSARFEVDDRGESWHLCRLHGGVEMRVVRSYAAGTWRGIHYDQREGAPRKSFRVLRGAAFVVWLLQGEGPWWDSMHDYECCVTHANPGDGFGWLSLEQDTVVVYEFDRPWCPGESVLYWNDPQLAAVPWPIPPTIMSAYDTPPA